jgi:hypothetical protein
VAAAKGHPYRLFALGKLPIIKTFLEEAFDWSALVESAWRDSPMELWTGLAGLVGDPKCEGFRRFGDDGKGAYVNVVAWADSAEAFVEQVRNVAAGLDCILLELDDPLTLDFRMEEPDFPEELITMRVTAQKQPSDTIFGQFHIWLQSDVN